ncbi:response regulator transcription factor [Paraconexibacter sp.]|uniref:response regulator transcription factor n=1 Tax=Paraconexibacter sp. TaxID=2949640 RepID=UPI00356B23B3
MHGTLSGAAATLDAIERLTHEDLTPQVFLEEASERIERVVPSDGKFISGADPETGLCMGVALATMPKTSCVPFWDYEFNVPDFNQFWDIHHGPRHAVDLHTATGGKPSRSARWRAFRDLVDYDAELRVAFSIDGTMWGMGQLSRGVGEPQFSAEEVAFVDAAAPTIARGLRRAITSTGAGLESGRSPGMLVLDAEDRVLSSTQEAEQWLRELGNGHEYHLRNGLPYEIFPVSVVARARHAAGETAPSMRVRTTAGTWLLLHGAVLSGTDGHVAVVIEPARASEVAPLIVQAYGLTPRETEVMHMITRGAKTAEIADTLYLSPHTVRDHVKAIFEKVGVSSRGELVATVFADHYNDRVGEAIRGFAQRTGAGARE